MRHRSRNSKLCSDQHHCGFFCFVFSFCFFQVITWVHFWTMGTYILGSIGSNPFFLHHPLQTHVFPSSGSVTSRLWLDWSSAQDVRALSVSSTNRRTPVVPSDLNSLLWFSPWVGGGKKLRFVVYRHVSLAIRTKSERVTPTKQSLSIMDPPQEVEE